MHSIVSLSQIADAEEFSYAFRNFLDEFYAAPSPAPLSAPPAGADRTRNAYLAATADFLCNRYELTKPAWLVPPDVKSDPFVADRPYFASSYWKTRIWLLADSPQEFRQPESLRGGGCTEPGVRRNIGLNVRRGTTTV